MIARLQTGSEAVCSVWLTASHKFLLDILPEVLLMACLCPIRDLSGELLSNKNVAKEGSMSSESKTLNSLETPCDCFRLLISVFPIFLPGAP